MNEALHRDDWSMEHPSSSHRRLGTKTELWLETAAAALVRVRGFIYYSSPYSN